MNLTITGAVFGVAEDFHAVALLLRQSEGLKTNTVAVRCAGKLEERVADFKPGDIVEAYGRITSREAKGRWYTAFEAEGLRLVKGGGR